MEKTGGDLKARSRSFADIAGVARHRRDWAFDHAADLLRDKALSTIVEKAFGKGELPRDVDAMLSDQGKYFLIWCEAALVTSPLGRALRIDEAARRLAKLADQVPSMEKSLRAIAGNRIYQSVYRMLLVARASDIDLQRSAMRIVDKGITPYEAKSHYLWGGTLAEYRMGSIVTGPSAANGHFTLYFPGENRENLKGNFSVTRVWSEYQAALA